MLKRFNVISYYTPHKYIINTSTNLSIKNDSEVKPVRLSNDTSSLPLDLLTYNNFSMVYLLCKVLTPTQNVTIDNNQLIVLVIIFILCTFYNI